jgi:hypothetical protein
MPTSYGDLRTAVSAYISRQPGCFVQFDADMLLRAINNAKNYCQRALDFEKAKVFGQLSVNLTSGGDLEDAVIFGTSDPLIVKSIVNAFLQMPGTATQFPIAIESRDSHIHRLKRRFEHVHSLVSINDTREANTAYPLTLVQYGNKLYLVPNDPPTFAGASTVTVYFDAIEWIPDFSNSVVTGATSDTVVNQLVDDGADFNDPDAQVLPGDLVVNFTTNLQAVTRRVLDDNTLLLDKDIFQTDGDEYQVFTVVTPAQSQFLLDFCFDYMLFRTLFELNFFIKEDVRVNISEKLLSDIWENVIKWNATFIANTVDDVTLD